MQQPPVNLPLPPPLMMSEVGSFAHLTLMQRLPAIARRVIAENDFPESIRENLERLIQELPAGKVRSLKDDQGADLTAWASYLTPFLGKSWLEIPWFFAEAYFYRRILEATHYFLPGESQGLDPFALQKHRGLETAMASIRAMCDRLNTHLNQPRTEDKTSLIALLYFALWGNRADLSLWPLEGEDANPSRQKIEGEVTHILVDDTSLIADKITSGQRGRIDVIVDNAGFELICDLCLADFLLTTQAAEIVYLHLKPHPTFVSDAMIEDVQHTVRVLAADHDQAVQLLAQRLQDYLATGRLCLHDDLFWTSPLAFWEMPEALQQKLAPSSLILSKGDANYRRCLGDRQWSFTTTFQEIVSYFPAPLAALRTLKSELAVGLKQSQLEALWQEDPHWLTNGQWGVIQFVSK